MDKLQHKKITIIIDTREKTPFNFPEWMCNTKRQGLKTGDYALENDTLFAVERKSIQDFASTITRNWERFNREMKRMQDFISKVIIIEGNLKDFCFYIEQNKIEFPKFENRSITTQFILSRIADLVLLNINCVFASDVLLASALTFQMLKNRAKQKELELWNKTQE